MKLFKSNKEEKCSCGGKCNEETIKEAENAKGNLGIKILGSGCAKCNSLESATKEALKALDMDTKIEHVSDFAQIATYGVMSTPALVVDGKVLSYGKTLKKEEIMVLIKKVRA